MQNGIAKQDGLSNGITHAVQPDANQSKMEAKNSNMKGNEKVIEPCVVLFGIAYIF